LLNQFDIIQHELLGEVFALKSKLTKFKVTSPRGNQSRVMEEVRKREEGVLQLERLQEDKLESQVLKLEMADMEANR